MEGPVSEDEDKQAASVRAAAFEQIRKAHQTELAEDYVELIADLMDSQGEARVVDLAEHLGVSQPTVTKVVQRLKRDGLVETRPYRSIFLTDAGRSMADEARRRHGIVRDFLIAIGVSEETAEMDAEGIEHHVSGETLEAFERVIATGGRPD